MIRIGVVGRGRFGSHLAHGLRLLGHDVAVRTRESGAPLAAWVADREVICLACRDDQLAKLVAELDTCPLTAKTVLLHSGTTPLALMEPLQRRGAVIGKFHPLMAFTNVADAPIPPDTPFACEGPIEHLVRPWTEAWSAQLYCLRAEDWRTYHLAAVLAANFLPLFIREGARLLSPLTPNQSASEALAWLAPLVRASVAAALDGANALPYSGPAVRGDTAVLAAQTNQLVAEDPAWAALYRQASELILAKRGALIENHAADRLNGTSD